MMEGSNSSSKPPWDLVFKLFKMEMYLVIDKIFKYLDDDTLREAELFSAEWSHMFSAGKIWRKRLNDKVRLSQEWKGMLDVVEATEPNKINEEDGYRTVYHLITQKLLDLDDKWKHGIAFPKNVSFVPPIANGDVSVRPTPENQFNKYLVKYDRKRSKMFGFNNKILVLAEELEGSKLTIRNRFNLQLITMLDIPIVRPSLRHFPFDCHPEIFSIEVNQHFIVASFYQDAEVCVWNAVTYNLLAVLDGDMIPTQPDVFDSFRNVNFPRSRYSLYGKSLLILNERESEIVCTKYNISSDPNELASVDYRKNLSSKLIVEAVFMDETFIVLVFTIFFAYRIETRSFSTFDIISVIDNQISFRAACFDYQRGVICAVLDGGVARFWNAADKICCKSVQYKNLHAEGNTNSVEPLICNIKMVKDKVVALTGDYWRYRTTMSETIRYDPNRFEIFSLNGIQNDRPYQFQLPNSTIDLRQSINDCDDPVNFNFNTAKEHYGSALQADEYQIGIVVKSPSWKKSVLLISDFCGDWGSRPLQLEPPTRLLESLRLDHTSV